jgi:Domain of unknown function (DUF397)
VNLDWESATWRKSTTSSSGGCVEVAMLGEVIGVRDTKDFGTGPTLVFNRREWSAFVEGVGLGEFDLSTLSQ